MIKVTNARFLQSCERFSQAPSILGAEIAILGRSNVGKSSLINALLNHKNLAKSSATPGKTRLINFFSAKWRVDSAESQNLGENISSLRADSQNLRGNPPIEKMQDLQGRLPREQSSLAMTDFGGLPRSHSLARNDENLDSSLRKCSTQNDKNGARVAESSADSANLLAMTENNDFAESNADFADFSINSALSLQDANSSIVDEFSQLCEASDKDRTNGSSRKRALRKCEKSPQDAEFAEFEIRILDFPGFGYARVSKAEKNSWDRHLSEFLHKRDSIKLYLHLIDARHQNLELDNEIFAFLNRFKRGDCAILQVFTKADKLGKNELFRLKKQNKFYHAINDKNSTEILRRAILKLLYNVDF